jgi:hypothetical protein
MVVCKDNRNCGIKNDLHYLRAAAFSEVAGQINQPVLGLKQGVRSSTYEYARALAQAHSSVFRAARGSPRTTFAPGRAGKGRKER